MPDPNSLYTIGERFPGLTSGLIQYNAPSNFLRFHQLLAARDLGTVAVRTNETEHDTYEVDPNHHRNVHVDTSRALGPSGNEVHVINRIIFY